MEHFHLPLLSRIRPLKLLGLRDPLIAFLWGCAVVLSAIAVSLRSNDLSRAFRSTIQPFATLAAILFVGVALDRAGFFRWVARAVIPARAQREAAFAGVLLLTALTSGLINLDVAVVVAVPIALSLASERHVPAVWLAPSIALTANATSFLLPTSNITNLLILGTTPNFWVYFEQSWLAWLLVTFLTIGLLTLFLARRTNAQAPASVDRQSSFRMIVDLAPLFVIAVTIRMLLSTGLLLPGGFVEQVAAGSGLAATVNNLPAAAAVHAVGAKPQWAAILAMAIGPNLLMTGSLATVICRGLAREGGVAISVARFSLLGIILVPLQIAVAALGLYGSGVL